MISTGYVGLVSGVCFAECGQQVIWVGVDADRVARLTRGEIPIYEPRLDALFPYGRRVRPSRFTTKTCCSPVTCYTFHAPKSEEEHPRDGLTGGMIDVAQ